MAPEFYDHLKFHPSWTRLLLQFIFDKRYTLFSRIERSKNPAGTPATSTPPAVDSLYPDAPVLNLS
jgi:sphingolipid delta-4 desaturase